MQVNPRRTLQFLSRVANLRSVHTKAQHRSLPKSNQMANTTKTGQPFDRDVLDSLLRRTGYYMPSFEIYGGEKGLFDYGPPLTALQSNFVDLWRKHFVMKEKMLEVDTTIITPEPVFITSGHVAKFADFMSKDPKTGEIFRTDHLIKQVLGARLKADSDARGQTVEVEKPDAPQKKKKIKDVKIEKLDDAVAKEYNETLARLDNYDGEGFNELINKFDIKGPTSGVTLDPPKPFNLMFQTYIGPSADKPNGYLRPETAQGQFLNFQKLLEFNKGKMPFASASVGKSFRNEISPRQGLLRVREFLMAEIEHYVDPEAGKKHDKFADVAHTKLTLLQKGTQLAGSEETQVWTIGEAVAQKVVDNETLGYFLVRIQDFLLKIGIDPTKLRFRQHMQNEMAHYAADCWDAECYGSYGWIECIGCADRSAYDLTVHMKKTGAPLVVRESLSEPKIFQEYQIDLNKKKLGPKFRKDAKAVETAVDSLTQDLREKLSLELKESGKITIDTPGIGNGKTELDKDLIAIEQREVTQHTREYTPNVIEPSFGIGRVLYHLLEHNFYTRPSKDEAEPSARNVLALPPLIAPIKVLIVPLSGHADFKPFLKNLIDQLDQLDIANTIDDSSASIGKRYSRNDELGTPFGVTIDFQTVKDDTVTLRERDSTKQVRATVKEICAAIESLVRGRETWKDVASRLPEFTSQEVE